MKVILNNDNKGTQEFIDCQHIKIDNERLMLIGNRVVSILIKDMTLYPENFSTKIKNSFLKDENIELKIETDKISATSI